MANGFGWIRRLFQRERRTQWTWTVQGSELFKPKAQFEPRVTFPQVLEPGVPGNKPEGKVVLGFFDGTQVALDDSHPLVEDFVNAADRMTRPARWKRLFSAKAGIE